MRALALTLALAALPPLAGAAGAAGVRIDLETREAPEAQPWPARVWVDGDRLRMEREGPDGAGALLFDGGERVLRLLDAAAERYVEIDRETLAAMREPIARVHHEMEARLRALPPGQRALVERALGIESHGGEEEGAERAPPAWGLRSTGEETRIDGHPARRLALLRGGEEVGAVWVTGWSAFDVSRLDLRVLRDFGDFLRSLREALAVSPEALRARVALPPQPFALFDELDGFPLRIRQRAGGASGAETAGEIETRFLRVERAEVDPARFAVPEGWERVQVSPAEEEREPGAP